MGVLDQYPRGGEHQRPDADSFRIGDLAVKLIPVAVIALAVVLGQPPPPPGAGLTASGTVIVMVNGIPVASGGVINIKSGDGVIAHAAPDPTLGGTDITFDADYGVLLSKAALQSAPLTVNASSANPSQSLPSDGLHYTGKLNPAVQAYTSGAPFVFVPDVPNLAGATLDLGLGPVVIQGSCPLACWVIYLPATSTTPAQFVVR